jgi:hypothetical protein
MWNGNTVAIKLFLAAASIVSIGGCDDGAAPRQSVNVAQGPQQLELPNRRYQIDHQRNRVWFLAREGVFVFDLSRPDRVAVPLPDWIWAGEPYSCLPDLALGPNGEAVVTSDVLPTLWRIDPDTLAVSVHPLVLEPAEDKDVGFSGLVYSPKQRAYFATSYNHGSLWRIDARLERADRIRLSAPIPGPCGLAVPPPRAEQSLYRLVDLCVRTLHGGWSVFSGSDWRSASVSAAPCTDRAWTTDVVSLNGR